MAGRSWWRVLYGKSAQLFLQPIRKQPDFTHEFVNRGTSRFTIWPWDVCAPKLYTPSAIPDPRKGWTLLKKNLNIFFSCKNFLCPLPSVCSLSSTRWIFEVLTKIVQFLTKNFHFSSTFRLYQKFDFPPRSYTYFLSTCRVLHIFFEPLTPQIWRLIGQPISSHYFFTVIFSYCTTRSIISFRMLWCCHFIFLQRRRFLLTGRGIIFHLFGREYTILNSKYYIHTKFQKILCQGIIFQHFLGNDFPV